MLEFVTSEKREYSPNIVCELRDIVEGHAIVLNVVFFYKSSWQQELLRLQRRNKFICALMMAMQECNMEGPRMRYPGQKESMPVYLQHVSPQGGTSEMASNDGRSSDPPFVEAANQNDTDSLGRTTRAPYRRPRGESLAEMGRRVDFSLGIKDVSASDLPGDVFSERERPQIPVNITSPVMSEVSSQKGERQSRRSADGARSTSIAPLGLSRTATDGSMLRHGSIHRNRFFGRGHATDDRLGVLEAGMANIPENNHLDPRSGTISPRAYRVSSEGQASKSAPPDIRQR
jgi:hypothetical protein